jgi:malate dehydrogenase (oxaloacetate-decarboxylating)
MNILEYRKKHLGLWEIQTKVPIKDSYSLSLVYTPGVGSSCTTIRDDSEKSFELTNRANSIAVLTDCSNFPDFTAINPLCGIPPVETKALLYKELAGIDAYPIVVNTHEIEEIAQIILNLAPNFAGFDLDDFLSERSATLERMLKHLNLPVIYSYRTPNLFFELEQNGFIDKINPAIVLPALMRGAVDSRTSEITLEMYESVVTALKEAENEGIINSIYNPFNFKAAAKIAKHAAKIAVKTKTATLTVNPEKIEQKHLNFLLEGEKALFKNDLSEYKSCEHTINENSIELHRKAGGVIATKPKLSVRNPIDFDYFYSANQNNIVTKEIELDYLKAWDLTPKGNLVAIISDGSAVLGFGNIGAEAALPVMEGKSALFKTLAGVDAVPVCLNTQDTDELIKIITSITPVFGGINLEDISAPRCFEIEKRLIEVSNIPIFHDDQHGTAVVVLAGFMNALKLTGKNIEDVKIVVNGAGAGATAVSKLLLKNGVKNLILCDTKGAIYQERAEGMNGFKEEMAKITNPNCERGSLCDVIKNADFFIGLSAGNLVTPKMVETMNPNPVIFALANPVPEIMPEYALKAGAFIVATGRSDLKNQINNSLAFPGIFRGVLDTRAKAINDKMKIAAAKAIAELINDDELNSDYIIPHALDLRVPPAVAKAVAQKAIDTGSARKQANPDEIFENTKKYLYGTE